MAKIDADTLVFQSGRKIAVECGVISIDSEGRLWEGSDSRFPSETGAILSNDEIAELADCMIDRWQQLKLDARQKLVLLW